MSETTALKNSLLIYQYQLKKILKLFYQTHQEECILKFITQYRTFAASSNFSAKFYKILENQDWSQWCPIRNTASVRIELQIQNLRC